jgi:phosphatidylethanolamine/phosphatidyl-N-methylethanolamine N-methyltransferase
MKDFLAIWSELIKNPRSLGTVAPSSPYLGKHLVTCSNITQNMNVVEIGAGTGPLTDEIIKITPVQQFWAFEPNSNLAEKLREKHNGLCVYENKANELPMIQERDKLPKADRILCSLPWSVFTEEMMSESLKGISEGLHPDGIFLTLVYAHAKYMPASNRLQQELSKIFGNVRLTDIEWRNIPPGQWIMCSNPMSKNE